MIAALFANQNWDDPKSNRAQYITELNAKFDEAIENVYNPQSLEEDQIDWNNPFWMAARRNLEKTRRKYSISDTEDASMRDVVEFDDEKLRAKLKSRRDVDQL